MAETKEKPDLSFLRIRDRWERARRNPKYLSLSKKAKFDKDGLLDIVETAKAGSDPNACTECAERFGLEEMIDPNKEFHELLGFASPPTQKELLSEDGKERVLKGILRMFLPNYDAVLPYPEPPGPIARMSLDGDYVVFELDISRSDEEIISEVLYGVRQKRRTRGIKVTKGGEIFAKRFGYYRIWDERKNRKPFEEIALAHKKHREEPLEKATDRVKKQFYKACELITKKKYDSEEWRKRLLAQKQEPTQEHLRLEKIDYGAADSSLYSDPEVNVLFRDIVRICENCKADPRCRDAILVGDLSSWDACPDIYSFSREA